MKIKTKIENFTGIYSGYNGIVDVNFNTFDLWRAFLSFGIISWEPFTPSDYFYVAYRSLLSRGIGFCIQERGEYLKIKNGFQNLDRSEKAIVNYYLGMAFSKLVYEKHLDIPFVKNADELIDRGQVTLRKKLKRSDLIGYNPMNQTWHAIECKGRSGRASPGTMRKAKLQSQNIRTIKGYAPATRSASIISLNQEEITAWVDDPDSSFEGVDLDFDSRLYFEKYFKYIKIYLESRSDLFNHSVDGEEYKTALIGRSQNGPIAIGLKRTLFESNWSELNSVTLTKIYKYDKEILSKGKDGVAIFEI